MLQSTQLLMRAEKEGSKEEATRERPEIDRAIKNLASLFGPDSRYILELRQSMQSNIVDVAKDPEGSFKSMAGMIYQLLKGSDAEKEQARQDIGSMRKNTQSRASEQDQVQIGQMRKERTQEPGLQGLAPAAIEQHSQTGELEHAALPLQRILGNA